MTFWLQLLLLPLGVLGAASALGATLGSVLLTNRLDTYTAIRYAVVGMVLACAFVKTYIW